MNPINPISKPYLLCSALRDWGRMGSGYIWESLSFRGCRLQMCFWGFHGPWKTIPSAQLHRNRSNRGFPFSSSFLIHSFFFFRTQHLQIDEDFAACLHLLEKSSSIQELLYGSNLFRCRLPRRLRPSCRRAKRDSPPKLPSNVLPTTRAGTPSKRKHSMKNSVTLS